MHGSNTKAIECMLTIELFCSLLYYFYHLVSIQNEFPDYFLILDMISKCENMSPPMSPQIVLPEETAGFSQQLPQHQFQPNDESPNNAHNNTTQTSNSINSPNQAHSLGRAPSDRPSGSAPPAASGEQVVDHTQAPSSTPSSRADKSIGSYNNGLQKLSHEQSYDNVSSSDRAELESLRLQNQRLLLKSERLELDVARLKSELHNQKIEQRQRKAAAVEKRGSGTTSIAHKKAKAELRLVELRVQLAMAQFQALKDMSGDGRPQLDFAEGQALDRIGNARTKVGYSSAGFLPRGAGPINDTMLLGENISVLEADQEVAIDDEDDDEDDDDDDDSE